MDITYKSAAAEDIVPIYQLCRQLILDYENTDAIDLEKVLNWVRNKIEHCIGEYTAVFSDGKKAGYYHFFRNEEGEMELDDLYIFPDFRRQGIGSQVIRKCCREIWEPVVLYVFIRNTGAVSLYERLGFRVVKALNGTRYIMKYDNPKKYYAAYEERYKTVHAKGISWSNDSCTPIVMEVIRRYRIGHEHRLLEIGCGEGRDSRTVLEHGYSLMATDISNAAITYCKKIIPRYKSSFRVLDCLSDQLDNCFDFIFGIAVIHMLVLDEDRDGFYGFVHDHLTPDGIALVCTMGDGSFESRSDISQAFTLQEREHESGKILVAGTSCRMVSFDTFETELRRNHLTILEKGITASLPNFNSLMYAVVSKETS